MTWSGSRLLCSELFGLELFGQPDMSCSCTLRELEPLHKEFICLVCVIYCVVQYQLKYIAICLMLFVKQPVIMCLYSYNHFGTNPMQLIKMKCCGAVSNEMLRSRLKWSVLEETPNFCLKENSEQCLENWLFEIMNLSLMEKVGTTPFCWVSVLHSLEYAVD